MFPLCAKHFKSASALWNHINSSQIFRQEIPAVTYFLLHNCLICSSLTCHWAYHKHFCSIKLSEVGTPVVVIRALLDPAVALADFQVKTLPLPTNLSSAHLVSVHKSLFMDPGNYDFSTLEHQGFLQSWRRWYRLPLLLSCMCLKRQTPANRSFDLQIT